MARSIEQAVQRAERLRAALMYIDPKLRCSRASSVSSPVGWDGNDLLKRTE